MIKRLVWTIILLSPAVVAGFIAIISGNDSGSATAMDLFNAGAAMNWTWVAIQDFIGIFTDPSLIWDFIWHAIVAAFFIAPYIFVWRGMFFIEWVPVIGHAFRIIIIAFIISIPGVMQILSNSDVGSLEDSAFLEQAGVYLEMGVLSLALIGLWLPKSMTTK